MWVFTGCNGEKIRFAAFGLHICTVLEVEEKDKHSDWHLSFLIKIDTGYSTHSVSPTGVGGTIEVQCF